MKQYKRVFGLYILMTIGLVVPAIAQGLTRTFNAAEGGRIEVINRFGRVEAVTESASDGEDTAAVDRKVTISGTSSSVILPHDVKIEENGGSIRIEVVPADSQKRIDISLSMAPRMRVRIETRDGEVRVVGDVLSADVRTDTGTIAADVPVTDLRYELHWIASRPRFLSDFELEKVKERSGGKFEVSGRIVDDKEKPKRRLPAGETVADTSENASSNAENLVAEKKVKPKKVRTSVSLNFVTERGIILLNIPPNEVSSDLRERPLTTAAKAIIRSGDSLLMEAIRRATPKYYGDYARTLPPMKLEPAFAERSTVERGQVESIKTASVRVNDLNNRAISGLNQTDFAVTEGGISREIVSVSTATAPVNLVLLLDVSGSVDNYVNFIRKAARSFVDTVDKRDRISIVTFNDEVKVLSGFTTDKRLLSESLDTFDAGGATAYYDSLAYTLAETLRPMKGERTAIVILTDGEDNRSFLPFDSLLSSIQESGALIYPLYVPSGLIAASESTVSGAAMDSLRTRYLQGELTSKAKAEGERLAEVSGGVYYPITQLSQIQRAYDEIASQLRTAYTIKFRSDAIDSGTGASPRIKVKVNRSNAFATVTSASVAN